MVVLNPGQSATPEDLTAFCRERVAVFKVPRRIWIVAAEAVPLTDTGKVAKRLVLEMFKEATI
jgi:acyl-CoA synthetase (AMP-forming)/AMP-acid ligase II